MDPSPVPGFPELYRDFGATDEVVMLPDVKGSTGSWVCVEEYGCDYEKIMLCAFDLAPSTQQKVEFLDCMDRTDPVIPVGTRAADPIGDAKSCVPIGMDFAAVEACFSGNRGDELLCNARDAMSRLAAKPTMIPAVQVNGDPVDIDGCDATGDWGSWPQCRYPIVSDAMCKAGSEAAACDGALTRARMAV